jgi:hypothetical protein
MNEDKEEPLDIIMRQTDYHREKAEMKLLEHDGNYMNVIKEYMGIQIKPVVERSKPGSLQQEIFTQIRRQMDLSIRDFNRVQNDKLEQELNKSST